MEIQYIREFVTLAEFGNYLTAAEELYISQSSLSKHILSLERELGFPLFIRTTRRMQLSEYGKLFLPYARDIADTFTAFHKKINTLNTHAKDTIQLGVLPSFLSYRFDQIIMAFKQQFPQYSISLTEDTSDMLLHHLKEGTCNLIVARIYEKNLPADFVAIPIFEDCLSLLVTPGSPFDGRTHITWKELESVELLTGSLNSKKLAVLINQMDIKLNIVSRMSRASSTADMLRKGVCTAALMNKLIARFYQKDGPYQIIDIEPPIRNTVYMVYCKDKPQTAAIKCFMEAVRTYIAKNNASAEEITQLPAAL